MVCFKRLYQIKISPVNEGFLNIGKVRRAAVNYNWQFPERGVSPDFLQAFITVLAGHIQIKEKEIDFIQVQEVD